MKSRLASGRASHGPFAKLKRFLQLQSCYLLNLLQTCPFLAYQYARRGISSNDVGSLSLVEEVIDRLDFVEIKPGLYTPS